MTDRVLVARLDNAGDVLLTGPAVRAIAASGASVTFLAGADGLEAAHLLPGVDRVVRFDAPWVGYDPPPVDRAALAALRSRVARLRPDRAILFTSFHQSALPLALVLREAGVPWIAAVSEDYPGALLDLRVLPDPSLHEVEAALALVAACGFPCDGSDGVLALRGLDRGGAGRRSVVVLHPGASVPARAIGRERAIEVARALVAAGWSVWCTAGPGERDEAGAIAAAVPAARLIETPDLRALAHVLRRARVLVSGNTGPAHVAAAVGTPVVSVFAPVVPAHRWRPWAVPHRLLGDLGIACAGCRARTCPLPEQACLASVTGAAVARAVASLVRPPASHRVRGRTTTSGDAPIEVPA